MRKHFHQNGVVIQRGNGIKRGDDIKKEWRHRKGGIIKLEMDSKEWHHWHHKWHNKNSSYIETGKKIKKVGQTERCNDRKSQDQMERVKSSKGKWHHKIYFRIKVDGITMCSSFFMEVASKGKWCWHQMGQWCWHENGQVLLFSFMRIRRYMHLFH